MKRKSKKRGRGSVTTDRNGRTVARVTFADSNGVRVDKRKVVSSAAEGWDFVDEIMSDVKHNAGRSVVSRIKTFADLADHYEQNDLVPPQYVGNRKIHGLRTYRQLKGTLNVLRAHFEQRPVKEITYRQIEQFKVGRFNTPIVTADGDRTRSVASVNRELALLRRLFRIAMQEGLITNDPFGNGKPLISLSDEEYRLRILSHEEEVRLLALIGASEERVHIRPIVICAIDTGMRRGEILSLRWQDVDLKNRTIELQALNTKTLRKRTVPISDRLSDELKHVRLASGNAFDANGRVFQVTTFKRSWNTALKLAKIEDLHFHDLRATFATRMIEAGMPSRLVAQLLGHSPKSNMINRYVRGDNSTLDRARELLNARR